MVMEEDDGTGTHFPLWDAEVLCQSPEVLCQVRDMDGDGDQEDNGTGTHFPLRDAEVLCQTPEVLLMFMIGRIINI